MATDTPQSKSYAALVDALKTHYEPKPLIIAERSTFNQRSQQTGESVADYIAELRRLAATCKFGAFLEEALRDRLVCSLRSESARRQLLADAEGEISLAKAVQLPQRDEQAAHNSKAFKGLEPSLKKLSHTPRHIRSSHGSHKPCFRCGRSNHAAKDCKFIEATCNFCHKQGHIAPTCLKKKNGSNARKNMTFSDCFGR